MRVAHFVHRYPPALGGAEAYFARLGRYLVAAGDSVTVHTSTALDLEAFWRSSARCLSTGRETVEGVEVVRYPLRYRFRGRRWVCKALSFIPHRTWQCLCMGHNPMMPDMWREAGRSDRAYDLVHATAFPYGWPLICGLRLARTLKIPYVLTPFLHTGDPVDPNDPTRRAYLQPALLMLACAADRIFAQTTVERDALLGVGIAAERIVLQGLGVDAEECTGGNREQTRRQWGVGEGEMVVGHLANNSEEKGTADLLRAASMAWALGSRFHVVLAGPEMLNFRRFLERYPDSARVRRLGVLSDEAKRDFFSALDVFALPSRSDSFGLVLLEAWANGVPNVGYRAGGVAGVIHHEADGLLVKCGDTEELAAALIRLEREQALRRRLGEAGRERTHREFRWEDKLTLVHETTNSLVAANKSN